MQRSASFFTLVDFLLPEEMNDIWRYVLSREHEFEVTQVKPRESSASVVDTAVRRSRVLKNLGPHRAPLALRLRSYLASVTRHLELPPFAFTHLDIQATASNDGEFFRAHTDNGSPPYQTRQITFVLYFHRGPKSFSGGDLILFDTRGDEYEQHGAVSRIVIPPCHNQLVFFPSFLLHEVQAVVCPSREFRDSRFTLNGWIYADRAHSAM